MNISHIFMTFMHSISSAARQKLSLQSQKDKF